MPLSSLRLYYEQAGVSDLVKGLMRWGSKTFATHFYTAFERSAKKTFGSPELDAGVKRAKPQLTAEIKSWADQQLKAYRSGKRHPDHEHDHLVLDVSALADALAAILREQFKDRDHVLTARKLTYIVNTLVAQAEILVIKEFLAIQDEKELAG